MLPPIESWLRWTPRLLTLAFACFLGLFATDVFGEGRPIVETMIAFAIHLLPSAMVLAALAIAWRWSRVGGLIFLGLGVWYIVMAWGQFPPLTYVIIAGPAFLIGVLFELSWLVRRADAR